MAGFLSPAHVEAYLKAVPDDGLMLLGEASPEILSCRRLFEYCCARLRAGLSLPVARAQVVRGRRPARRAGLRNPQDAGRGSDRSAHARFSSVWTDMRGQC